MEQDIDMTRTLVGQRLKWQHNWLRPPTGMFEVARIELTSRNTITGVEWYVVCFGHRIRKNGTVGMVNEDTTLALADVPHVDLQRFVDDSKRHAERDALKWERRLEALRAEVFVRVEHDACDSGDWVSTTTHKDGDRDQSEG